MVRSREFFANFMANKKRIKDETNNNQNLAMADFIIELANHISIIRLFGE